jgi:hypothetical protein
MQQSRDWTENGLAGLGVLAAALWVGSLFADVGVYPLTDDVPHEDSGWVLLQWGWIGPFVLSVAWYGNILFVICIVMLLRGRELGTRRIELAADNGDRRAFGRPLVPRARPRVVAVANVLCHRLAAGRAQPMGADQRAL